MTAAQRMPGRIGFETVWSIGLAISGVEDSMYYGLPALKLNGRMVACVAGRPVDDAETLAIPVSFERRDELLASDPDTFYVTDHYVKYPVVLARLDSVDVGTLRELLTESCRAAAALPPPRPRRKTAPRVTRPARKAGAAVSRRRR